MNRTTFLGEKPINRTGFGAMQLAGPGVFGPPSDPGAARAVLRRAVELGVDHMVYDRMLLITGTGSIAHLEENMAAIELELDLADLAALDRVGQRGITGIR